MFPMQLTSVLILNGSRKYHKYHAIVNSQKEIDIRLKRLYTKWNKRHPKSDLKIHFCTSEPSGSYPILATILLKNEVDKANKLAKIEAEKLELLNPTEPEQPFRFRTESPKIFFSK